MMTLDSTIVFCGLAVGLCNLFCLWVGIPLQSTLSYIEKPVFLEHPWKIAFGKGFGLGICILETSAWAICHHDINLPIGDNEEDNREVLGVATATLPKSLDCAVGIQHVFMSN